MGAEIVSLGRTRILCYIVQRSQVRDYLCNPCGFGTQPGIFFFHAVIFQYGGVGQHLNQKVRHLFFY